MKKTGIVLLGGIAALALLILLLVSIDLSSYKSYFIPQVEKALGRPADVSGVRLSLWPFGLRLRGVTIEDDPAFSKENFFKIDSVVVGLRFFPLLRKEVEIDQLVLLHPELRLIQNKKGEWNTSTLGQTKSAESEAGAPSARKRSRGRSLGIAADKIEIREGKVTYFHEREGAFPPLLTIEKIGLTLLDLGLGKVASLDLRATLQPVGPAGPPGATSPSSKEAHLQGKIGAITAALRPETISFSGEFGRSVFRLDGGFQKGRLALALDADEIDLDELILLIPQTSSPEKEAGSVSTPPPSSKPLDKGEAKIDFNLKKIRLKGIEATQVTGKMEIGKKSASLEEMAGDLWGGRIKGAARIDRTASALPFSTSLALEKVSLGALAKESLSAAPELFSGVASLNVDLKGSGAGWSDLSKSLTGEGSWEVGAGEIRNLNLLKESLALLQASGLAEGGLIPPEGATSFSSAKGELKIESGEVALSQIRMESPLFDLAATGEVGLDGNYKFTGEMALSEAVTRSIKKTAAGSLLSNGQKALIPIEIKRTPEGARLALRAGILEKGTERRLKEKLGERLKDGLGNLLHK